MPSPTIFSDRIPASELAGSARRIRVAALVVFVPFLYCVLHYFFGQLKSVHVLFSLLVAGLYFATSYSRIFVLLAIPFALKDVMFDAIRHVPFDWLKPIHVSGPYWFELLWFGVPTPGGEMLLNEYFLRFLNPFLDFLTGAIYFLNEPVAILLIFLFWRVHSKELAERYSVAFLVMNLFAFLTYIFCPVAAPWYVAKYGLVSPLSPVIGDPAGLIRFDQMIGFPFAEGIYTMNPVVFGAIPSMHAGFCMLGFIYALRTNWKWASFLGTFTLFMCFSALYLQHHYVIDLLLGILYALFAYLVVEFLASGLIGRSYRFLTKNLVQEGPRPFFG